MWYIYAREDVRRRRLSESRNYTPEKIEKIIASQLSEEEFRQHCDFVIDNSDSLEDSYRPVSYTHLDVYKRQPLDLWPLLLAVR